MGFSNVVRDKRVLVTAGWSFISVCYVGSQFKNRQWYPTSLAGIFLYNIYVGNWNWNNYEYFNWCSLRFFFFYVSQNNDLTFARFFQWQTRVLNSSFCMCIITLGHDYLHQISDTPRSGGVYAILRFRRWSPENCLGIAIRINVSLHAKIILSLIFHGLVSNCWLEIVVGSDDVNTMFVWKQYC